MRSVMTNQEYTYASQLVYENGQYICTPVCVTLCWTYLKGITSFPLTGAKMDMLMRMGGKVYDQIQARNQRLKPSRMGEKLLQIQEVIDSLKRKQNLESREIYGTTEQVQDVSYSTENGIWLLKELLETLNEKSSLVLTLENENHTIAIICSKEFLGEPLEKPTFWLFDPLVASLTSHDTAAECARKIQNRKQGGTIFTGVVCSLV